MTEQQKWFLKLWDKQEMMNPWGKRYVVCFETGKALYREKYRENWSCYSHILRKEKYGEYKMEDFNVKIVNPQAHWEYTHFPEKAKKQYTEYKKLLSLHLKGDLGKE